MSNRSAIQVKTCKLNWTFGPTYIIPDFAPSAYSPEFFANDDINLRWRFELDRERQFCGAVNVILGLRVWHENVLSDEVRERGPIDRGPIAGEATIGIKFTTFNSVPKCLKCPFVRSEENLISNAAGTNNFIFRYTIGQISSVVIFSARLTCEVSYLNVNDALPLLISKKYALVPIEANSSSAAAVDGGFEEMYLNKEFSDVTLCVNGTDYHAHKMILAAHSKVFKAMFQHDMQERKLNRVQIQNINEPAFLQALRYLYTGKVEDVQSLAYDLLPVADRYDIEGLKKLCAGVLHAKLELNTVVNILLLADSYNVNDLRIRAIQFMIHRSKDVLKMMTAKERKEIRSRPDLMMDLFDILMTK